MLAGKISTVGITGGIAVFKAAQMVSSLKACGAEVNVIMTRSAQEFVKPLTFQVLSGNSVRTDLFDEMSGAVQHIELATRPELVVIAPATANILGKAANGIADDLLSTVIMAASCPVLFCPAMNVNMYNNPVVQRNISSLRELGYEFVEPGTGRLACGVEGQGRLADLDRIWKK
jgi:phosphopantothenoylcysteine decarboxylase/phosphopantothenate--cysteine ligase